MKKLNHLICVLACTAAFATQAQSWTNSYTGSTLGANAPVAVITDAGGNVIVTGHSSGPGGWEYATVKFTGSGTPMWTNRFAGTAAFEAIPTGLATDSASNVFVTGYADDTVGGWDFATIKYSASGTPMWTNIFNDTTGGFDQAQGLAVDSGNNVYVAGTVDNAKSNDALGVIKYSNNGLILWTTNFNSLSTNGSICKAMAMDPGGNVSVSGIALDNSDDYHMATVRYSSAGSALWTNFYSGSFTDAQPVCVAVDTKSNVVVVGYSDGGAGALDDYVTIDYAPSGVPLWTNRYNGPLEWNDYPAAVAVDGAGNVYVTGATGVGGGIEQFATIKYLSTGVPQWTNLFNFASEPASANAIALDSHTNVYVSGFAYTTSSAADFLTVKYSTAGVALATNEYNDPSNLYDYIYANTVDTNGYLIVAGSASLNSSDTTFTVIKYGAVAAAAPYFSFLTTAASGFGFTSHLFGFTLSGPAGSNAVIEISTNLTVWTPIKTNSLGTGQYFYSDPQSSTNKRSYYRALLRP